MVVFDVLTLIVVCLNALDRPRTMDAKIATVLYRDGILYFVVILVIRAGVLLLTILSTPLGFAGFPLSWALITVIVSRLLLSLYTLEEDLTHANSGDEDGRATSVGDVQMNPLIA